LGNSRENTDYKATIASHSARLSKNLGRKANTGIESEEPGSEWAASRKIPLLLPIFPGVLSEILISGEEPGTSQAFS
jgi:hypothetical protein